MSEYISKEKLLEKLDVDAPGSTHYEAQMACIALRQIVSSMPTINLEWECPEKHTFKDNEKVEVVRCKDCVWFVKYVGYDTGLCKGLRGRKYIDEFCNYGEKK